MCLGVREYVSVYTAPGVDRWGRIEESLALLKSGVQLKCGSHSKPEEDREEKYLMRDDQQRGLLSFHLEDDRLEPRDDVEVALPSRVSVAQLVLLPRGVLCREVLLHLKGILDKRGAETRDPSSVYTHKSFTKITAIITTIDVFSQSNPILEFEF